MNPTGTIPNGKAIESYSIDYPKVTIFGNASFVGRNQGTADYDTGINFNK